jgi:hypothetical protein
MRKTIAGLFLLMCTSAVLWAEETYQRLTIDKKKHELTIEGGLRYWAQTMSAETETYTLNPRLGAEYNFDQRHSVNLEIPYYVVLYDEPDTSRSIFYGIGDIQLSYIYTKKLNYANLFFTPQFVIPAGEASEYAAREGIYTPGSGRWDIGFSFAVTGIRDPVVWTLGFKYDVGLPKKEQFYTSWQPGNMQLSGSLLKLSNERFGLSLGLYQNISLPQINSGKWDSSGFSASTFFWLESMVMFDKDYVKITAEMYAFPLNRPVTIGLTYGHTFKKEK